MSEFPYPGLRPFQRDETDIFFGHEALSSQLIKRLGNTHFLAVAGPSGCGKSSLVRAGLLAGLERGSRGTQWQIVELCPSHRPFARLADAWLADETALGQKYTAHFVESSQAPTFLQVSLRRGANSLHDILTDISLPQNTKLLIVIDQFEELFSYCQQGDKDEITSFIKWLLTSSQHVAVHIIITLRLDLMSECAEFEGLPEAINQGLFLIPRLTTREQLQIAIEGPARVFGGEVEQGLVTRLLDDIKEEPDPLPQLQQVLMRMWHLASAKTKEGERIILGLKHYKNKVKVVLSQHAEEAYAELEPPQQKIAEILFRSLSKRSKSARHPVKLNDVATLSQVPWQAVAAVVEVFRKGDRHLLTPSLDIDLIPDSLLNFSPDCLIRKWQRLKEWADEEANSAALFRRLQDSAFHWDQKLAELWYGRELEAALKWRKQPTALWAKHEEEVKEVDLVTRFLEAGVARQRKLKYLNIFMLVLLAVSACVIGLGALLYWQYQASEAAQQTVQQTRTLSLFESQLSRAVLLTRLENYAAAKKTLAQTRELDPEIDTERRHARNLLAWFNQLMGGVSQPFYQPANHKPLTAVAVSFNGQWLATTGDDGILRLFDIRTGQLLQHLQGHTGKVNAVVFQPQGQWLASAGDDRRIIRWSLPTGKQIRKWKASQPVQALAVSLDGKYLASGGKDNKITLWNAKTGRVRRTFRGHSKPISDLAFSPSGKLLASASYDGTARLWQVNRRNALRILTGHTDTVQKVAFSPDGKWLATSSGDKSVRLWKVASGKTMRVLLGHQKTVYGVRFVVNGHYLVSASGDSTLRVWDTQSGVTLRVLQGHSASVTDIAAFDEQIFSSSLDGTVKRWNITTPYQQAMELHKEPASTVIAPDGKKVAIGFADGSLRLYALPKLRFLWKQERAHTQRVQNLAFSPDGTLLASASFDGTAKLWQFKGNQLQEQQTFSNHTSQVTAVAFSPDGKTLATAGYDGKIGLFTVGTKQKRLFQAHKGKKINSVFFNDSGTQLLSSSEYEVRRWNLNKNPPQVLQTYPKSPEGLAWATFSPDSQQIASVGREKSVLMYSTTNKFTPYHLTGHESTVFRVSFSPDGKQIATVSADATLRFWDLHEQGRELFTLRLPANRSYPVPVWDFDFRCTQQGDCWVAVPLTRGKLVLYELKGIFGDG